MYILALTGLQEDKEQDWRRDRASQCTQPMNCECHFMSSASPCWPYLCLCLPLSTSTLFSVFRK